MDVKWQFRTVLISLILTMILSLSINFLNLKYKSAQLTSPLLKGEKVLGNNLWFPDDVSSFFDDAPIISAKGALFVDSQTGQTLYAKNATQKLPIASLVKVMTSLIALEHKKLEEEYLVSQRAAEMEPDKMLLIPGERLSLKELLYGVFLISANDAAEVLAEGTLRQAQGKQGSREEFIKLMNIKAKQLGMESSYFVNPTGLDEDSHNSYSSTLDMAILTRYLVRYYPQIVEISQTSHIILPKTSSHQDYDIYSGINLLTTYPGVVGFKTGYTPEAGLTLITLARKDGHEVIGVILGSEKRRDEARELLDYSFKKINN